MIAELRPYPAIKDSGVTWLGEIPEHWEVMPICALARRRQQTNEQQRELLSVYLGRGVVPFSSVDEKRTNPTSEDLSKYQAVEPGDFVLNNQQAWRGSVGVSRYKGIVSPAYLVLALDGRLKQEYADRLLSTPPMVTQYLVSSKGVGSIQRNLYWPHLRRVAVLVPPTTEQAAIVRFLDHADHKIRRYIRAKQKLIKLLEEQKQVIIHRAVTHGLDPNVRLKPSGVEWLGDVPEHWEVRRVRNCLEDTRAGIWGDDPTPANEADHVTCLRVADFDMTSLGVNGSKLTQRAVPESARLPRLLAAGDILMEKSGGGEAEPVGRVVLHDENVAPYAICSNFIIRLRPNRSATPQFLLHVLAIMQITRRNVPCIKQTTGIQNLDERAYLALAIGVPPIAEQRAITASLREHLLPIEQGVNRARHEINLLREYHTRLIADVVTGKLNVRQAAAQLTDEDQELPPIDESDEISDAEEDGFDDLDEGSEDPEP
jgi:type I restriction enzyme S subunit